MILLRSEILKYKKAQLKVLVTNALSNHFHTFKKRSITKVNKTHNVNDNHRGTLNKSKMGRSADIKVPLIKKFLPTYEKKEFTFIDNGQGS